MSPSPQNGWFEPLQAARGASVHLSLIIPCPPLSGDSSYRWVPNPSALSACRWARAAETQDLSDRHTSQLDPRSRRHCAPACRTNVSSLCRAPALRPLVRTLFQPLRGLKKLLNHRCSAFPSVSGAAPNPALVIVFLDFQRSVMIVRIGPLPLPARELAVEL
jgi:hypothetical protein